MSDRVEPAPAPSAAEDPVEGQLATVEGPPPQPTSRDSGGSSFAAVRWRTSDLVIGLLILAATTGSTTLRQLHAESVPMAVQIVLGWLLPLATITAWPIWAYRQGGGRFPLQLPSPRQLLREALWAMPSTLLTLALLIVVSWVWQSTSGETVAMEPRMRSVAYSGSLSALAIFTVATCIGAPLVEELFFRGFLQNALAQRMPLLLAIAVQSGLFAASHDYTGMRVVAVLVMGIVLTAHYLWRKTLTASICLHAGINGMAMVATALTMFAVSNSPVLGARFGDPEAELRITGVYSGSAAHQAGLRPGDVLLELNGQGFTNLAHLQDALVDCRVGDTVVLVIDRNGERLETSATLTSREKLGDLISEALPDVAR